MIPGYDAIIELNRENVLNLSSLFRAVRAVGVRIRVDVWVGARVLVWDMVMVGVSVTMK